MLTDQVHTADSSLGYFRENFHRVRSQISPDSPLGNSAVRLRDAEMQVREAERQRKAEMALLN